MRVATSAVVSLAILSANSDAFRPLRFSSSVRQATAVSALKNLHEFDYLLGEQSQSQQLQSVSRRRIDMRDDRATVLTSSTFAAPGVVEDTLEEEQATEGSYDPYADVGIEQDPQLAKIQQTKEQSVTQRFESKLKTMDLQDIISTLIIPSIVLFAAGRWGFNKVSGRVAETVETTLDAFAREMIYHDGDFEEMKMCHGDYSKKLLWLGPKKTQAMLKRYLALYSKKRTVSPQAIR
jgi:hypothetical protein